MSSVRSNVEEKLNVDFHEKRQPSNVLNVD